MHKIWTARVNITTDPSKRSCDIRSEEGWSEGERVKMSVYKVMDFVRPRWRDILRVRLVSGWEERVIYRAATQLKTLSLSGFGPRGVSGVAARLARKMRRGRGKKRPLYLAKKKDRHLNLSRVNPSWRRVVWGGGGWDVDKINSCRGSQANLLRLFVHILIFTIIIMI